MRIWHQSYTVLEDLPGYAQALADHLKRVARPDTEIVLHGMKPGTYTSNYPGTDIRHAFVQHLHTRQFLEAGLKAEQEGYDGYLISTLPEPGLIEARSVLDIPVTGYAEAALHTACFLGESIGVLNFIEELGPLIRKNAERRGLASRLHSVRHVGFTFNDVLPAFENPKPLIERFEKAARAMIADGADAIIPGEAPLCVLLAHNRITRVDDVPIVDALAAGIKMIEMLVDLKQTLNISVNRRGYYYSRPHPERVRELTRFYGF